MMYTPFTNKKETLMIGNQTGGDTLFYTLTKDSFIYVDDNGTTGSFPFITTCGFTVTTPDGAVTTLMTFAGTNIVTLYENRTLYPVGSTIEAYMSATAISAPYNVKLTTLEID